MMLVPAIKSENELVDPPTRDILEDFGGGVSEGLPITGDYNCVGVEDIDDDGNLDMVIGAEENYGTLGTTGLYAYFGNGNGNWTQHTITTTGSYAAIEIADVDNDGYKEVFAGHQENTNGIGAWEWDGSQFQTTGISSPVTNGNVNYLRIENISGDSGLDIVSAANGGVKYFQGSGTSPITWTEYSSGLRSRGLCTSADVNDLNNDGYLDIVVGQYGDGLYLFTQNGGSTTWNDESNTLPTVENSGRILGLVTGDVNNDGNIDLIYGRRTTPTGLFLLLGNGGGVSGNDLRWTYLNESWTSRPGGSFYQMHLDDVDNDGDLDLLAAREDYGLHLYLGNGSDDPGSNFGWTEVTSLGLPSDMKFFGSNYLDLDNDGDLDVAGCTWGNGARVYRNNVTQPEEPIARAGMDITMFLGNTTSLDGRNSSDAQDCPDGDAEGTILHYDWNLTGQPVGSSMSDIDLDPSDNSAVPSFTPTHAGNYSFTLTVRDTEDNYAVAEDVVRVSVILINTAPVADAGQDIIVHPGALVALNGSRSHDEEDSLEQLEFLWEANSSNPEAVILTDPDTSGPSFTAPSTVGKYGFELIVTDSMGLSSLPDEVNITVELRPNELPTADAGEDIDGIANSTIILNGTGSFDPDGEIVTWIWNCTNEPLLELTDENSSTPEFTVDGPGEFIFSLVAVDDRGGMSLPDSVTVSIITDNYPPMANAGKNQTVNRNTTVFLNGTLSSDPEENIITWEWITTSHPGLVLNNTNSSTPDFYASEIGEYLFSLRVMDHKGLWSQMDIVKVTVVEEDVNITDPIENTLPEIQMIQPSEGDVLNGTIEVIWNAVDEDGDPLTITIEFIAQLDMELFVIHEGANPVEQRIALNTSEMDNGEYEFRITVYDGFDEVTVTIYPLEINNIIEDPGDDDDDDDIVIDDDDDDEGAPPEEDNKQDDGWNIQIIIAIIVGILVLALVIFALSKRIYENMSDRDDLIEE